MGSPDFLAASERELTVGSVIDDHRKNPPEKTDLMQAMLTGRDKETGMTLTDDVVRYNVRSSRDTVPNVLLTKCAYLVFDFPHRWYETAILCPFSFQLT